MARESGVIKKKWKGRLPVALVFPNRYSLGMSNLGFQLIYELLNARDDVVCERVFYDPASPPLSVESNHPLSDFPIILFSVSFEDDFPNIVKIIDGGGLEPLAAQRSGSNLVAPGNPLLIGGGVATFINPEPLAPIFDMIVIGEAEPVLPQVFDYLLTAVGSQGKDVLLSTMASTLAGCYVPSLYEPDYNPDGTFAGFHAAPGVPERVAKMVHGKTEVAGHSTILSPDAEFANIYLTELGRGCSRGCRFCAAGFVYRPPRLWDSKAIIGAMGERPAESGRVGLLGMEMAQASDLQAVSEYLLKESCALSFSSLRADVITPTILKLLGQSSLKSAAIAPDGPSERLRRVISKHITEEDVIQAATALVRAGIRNLKLYFMIGLPTEEEEDLDEMVSLIRKVHREIGAIGRGRGRLSELVLSVNSFVPKAWTPFQYYGFATVPVLKRRIKFLRKAISGMKNIKMTVDNPDRAFFQATMARGDRRVGEALVAMARTTRNWRHVLKELGVDPSFYAERPRPETEIFPWEIVAHGIKRRYLWKEYMDALEAKPSKGCEIRTVAGCKRCGVCRDK